MNVTEFPLASGWATKEVQKYGKKGGGKRIKKRICAILEECFLVGNVDKSHRMTAQDMWNFLNCSSELQFLISIGPVQNRSLFEVPLASDLIFMDLS